MPHTFTVHTPLGDALKFHSLRGTEELSRPYAFELGMVSKSPDIDVVSLLGENVTVEAETQRGGRRYLNGDVSRFTLVGREGNYYRYQAQVVPWIWYMTRQSHCRIFQKLTVPDILTQIFNQYDGAWAWPNLEGHYRTWEYCCQYQETDFNFVSRLMEQEGLYYYFQHAKGSHKLIVADSIGGHDPLPGGYDSIPYHAPDAVTTASVEHFDHWMVSKHFCSGAYRTNDYDFRKPKANLVQAKTAERQYTNDGYLIYDNPGEYTEAGDGDNYAGIRLQEMRAAHEVLEGTSNARGLAPGYLFNLTRCPRRDQNREYLILSVRYDWKEHPYESRQDKPGPTEWRLTATCQPSSVPYRAPRITPKPLISGPLTAVVKGPVSNPRYSEDIYTDEYGRVKVLFHWDIDEQYDEDQKKDREVKDYTCWIRVAQIWAGTGFGGMFIPRIGQEVIVEFVGGDPDQPLITGRVYNKDQEVPYVLPRWATMSTIKTRSTPKGGVNDANELRFEDYKGKEQLFLLAQRRMDVRVKWNKYLTVQESRHTRIQRSDMLTIGGKHQVTVGNDFGHRVETKYQESAGGVFQTIAESDSQLSADGKIELNAPNILLEAAQTLTLKVGANIVKIDMSGITIQGTIVRINCGGGAGPATPIEFEDPDGAEEADTGVPGYLDQPRKRSGGAKKKRKGGKHRAPITGLGPDADGIAGRSPKLAANLDALKKDGWTIKYGTPGKGSFCDKKKKEIVLDPNKKDDPASLVRTLSHESGHARYTADPYVQPAGLSKDDYVKKNANRSLKDEGEATLTNAEVRNEILGTDGGPDIGISGTNQAKYDAIAKKYPDPKDRDKARQEIADIFADNEHPSTDPGKTYRDYYSKPYADYYDKTGGK